MPLVASLPWRALLGRRAPLEQARFSRMYGLPTRHGLYMALVLLSLVALGLRVENNMLIAVAALLSVVFFLSILWGAANLSGARIRAEPRGPVLAGRPVEVRLSMEGLRPPVGVRIADRSGQRTAAADTPHQVVTRWVPSARGRHAPCDPILETTFPFNMVRIWVRMSCSPVPVAPSPLPVQELRGLGGLDWLTDGQQQREETPTEMAQACGGDPLSRLLWKRFASRGQRLVRAYGLEQGAAEVALDYARYAAMGHECALSVLCGALLACEADGRLWRLRLPSCEFCSTSPLALTQGLHALALA